MSLLRKRSVHFDVPIQDLTLRITGPDELYEEARAAGMQFWEQVQSYAIRYPGFQSAKRPLPVPEDGPVVIQEMVATAAMAGVGPMFTFRGALVEFVGRHIAQEMGTVTVTCEEDHFVVTDRRSRLGLHTGPDNALGIVVDPELGPCGVFSSIGARHRTLEIAEGLVIVARSCILADAAAAGATAVLSKPDSFKAALAYLQRVPGVHGGMIVRGERIGVAGSLELAA